MATIVEADFAASVLQGQVMRHLQMAKQRMPKGKRQIHRTATNALEERREKIARAPARKPQLARVIAFLEKEIWPNIPKNLLGRRVTKTERERVLGYGKHGV